jgi:histidine triad (HIT) family protein
MASLFSRIVNGEIPSYKVAENNDCLAFLDINPLVKGHVLVIPKKEVDYIFDLDDELYQSLWLFARQVSHAVRKAIPCKRIGVAVIGLEVPHAHIHLIPMNRVSDMNFASPKLSLSKEELQETAEKISREFNA